MNISQPLCRTYVYLFAALGMVFAVFCAWNLPPFMGPDEPAHFHRANLLLLGHLVGSRGGVSPEIYAGGMIDVAAADAMAPYMKFIGKPDPLSKADYAPAENIGWDDRKLFAFYPNTAVYPPFFYLPQTIGIAIGKAAKLSIIQTLYVARSANAVVCIAIGMWALALAGRARVAMFTLLLLPMSIGVYSAMTQDGICLVTTALGCAFISGALSDARKMNLGELIGAAICFALVGMTKQPYAVFPLVLLAAPFDRSKLKYAIAAAAFLASAGWHLWMALAVQTKLNPLFDPEGQMNYLLGHLSAIFPIAQQTLTTFIKQYSREFIGVLGWLDTPLPSSFYSIAGVVVFLSFAFCASRGRYGLMSPLAILVMLTSIALIFGGLYVSWTPVGAPMVQGVQGRYFLPVCMLLVLALLREKPLVPAENAVGRVASLAILAFPFLSLLVAERAIIVRYYLS